MNHLDNGSFSTTQPGLQVVWDSTSLGWLKECPRKYQYSMIEGWRNRREALPLTFGILYHKALETYNHQLIAGETHNQAVLRAVRMLFIESATRQPDGTMKPWRTDATDRNLKTLVRAFVWYTENYRHDTMETVRLANGRAAVEVSFKLPSPYTTSMGEPVSLSGHLDRIATQLGGTYILDPKTTTTSLSDSYFGRYSPDNQMSLYTIAGQVVLGEPVRGVMIDAVQVGVTYARFARRMVHRTPVQSEEWMRELGWWLAQAEAYAEASFWPMNDKSCFLCNFKEICSKDPSVRQKFLEGDFHRSRWDPTKPR